MKKPISAKQQRPSSWLQPSKRLQAQHDTLRQMPNLKRNEFEHVCTTLLEFWYYFSCPMTFTGRFICYPSNGWRKVPCRKPQQFMTCLNQTRCSLMFLNCSERRMAKDG